MHVGLRLKMIKKMLFSWFLCHVIDIHGKRSEMCFTTGSIVKIENNKLLYDKNRLEDCDSE